MNLFVMLSSRRTLHGAHYVWLGAVICLITTLAQPVVAKGATGCPPPTAEKQAGGSSPGTGSTGNVELTTKTEQFAFGSSGQPYRRTIVLAANPRLQSGSKLVAESVGDLEAEGGASGFPSEAVIAEPKVNSFGNVVLKMCLDPHGVSRGRYVGAIQVGGDGVETASVPVEVTLRKPLWVALVAAGIGMLLGLVGKMLADLDKDKGASVGKKWIMEYVTRGAFWAAVLLGVLGVALSLWQVYDVNQTWGTLGDIIKIGLAGVALQVTGGTLVDFVKPYASVSPQTN